MRKLILAAVGVLVVAGAAAAQQPRYAPTVPSVPPPGPGAAPVQPAGLGAGCASGGCGAGLGAKFTMATGGNCQYGRGCQNGCGSVKSDLAFHFGSCKSFFNPCGPVCGSGFLGGKCPPPPLNAPYGTGWCCPRQYDSYANH